MQFPCDHFKPCIYSVGIATFSDFVETLLNRITCDFLGTALTISHAIPSQVFHAVIHDRWNPADSNVLWGCAVVELHAELGSSLFRGRAIAQGHCTA